MTALLLACSVEKGKGHGGDRRSDQHREHDVETGKISANAFATEAGTTADHILRHLAAWQRLAHTRWSA